MNKKYLTFWLSSLGKIGLALAMRRLPVLPVMTALNCAILLIIAVLAKPVLAQQADPSSWWQTAKHRAADIMNDGKLDVYLSGYIHHGRNTYSAERISELNEKNAWGLGIGKTVRNDKLNDESLYFFGINDSHFNPQWMAGYAYLWVGPIAKTRLEVSAGWTAQLMSRSDYFGGIPFPVVLPVAALGTQGAKIFFTYVPRISKNKGNGDILFVFGRIEID